MNGNDNANRGGAKKPYRKPRVQEVALRPEEAVLGSCKISSTAGPAAADCTTLTCNTAGS